MSDPSPLCRFCSQPLRDTFADLGNQPVANNLIAPDRVNDHEPLYPLHVFVCSHCLLVQTPSSFSSEDIFTDRYPYFSSFSSSWLDHSRMYAENAITQFNLNKNSMVIEVASNDGYLLKNFLPKKIPVLGIEPTANTARAAISAGIPTEVCFLTEQSSVVIGKRYGYADLLIANNVFAHVPDINDFTKGLKNLLAPGGVLTMEFAHVLKLMENTAFDTIYHEHFYYHSLHTVSRILISHELHVYDAEELPTHGGSLRIYAKNMSDAPTDRMHKILEKERKAGLMDIKAYTTFDGKIRNNKQEFMKLLGTLKGHPVAAYGAPAKGNTLLNYYGLTAKDIAFTVDKNPAKQGMILPGSRIPVFPPDEIKKRKPEYILILPWNIKKEIMGDLSYTSQWGASFIVPVPHPKIIQP